MRLKDTANLRERYARFVERDEFLDPDDATAFRTERTKATVNAVGHTAKAFPYQNIGHDVPGPDTTARNGPRPPNPPREFGPTWKGAGSLGLKVESRLVAPVPSSKFTNRIPSPEKRSAREWHDPSYSGVVTAGKYHDYFASGEHKVHSYEQKPSYKQKKTTPPGVVVGRGGNLGQYSKIHAGWDTRSSVTLR
eukprot:CAMPEP_0118943030 /NCGR_PEP_ID=MMETSP1169-20130426/37365_1 /TAXON_ID=36882 /ORGANISM="Pyramimonas obovata, Strain CCMP722" /LENGTH=192 /DNA_ID=CAMNT_0006888175 /DNA_START=84 /DNA_END=662 /DNA_ORIENTATION=-